MSSRPVTPAPVRGADVDTRRLRVQRRLENRPRLHAGDLRVGIAQPTATVAQHRIRLGEPFHGQLDILDRATERCGEPFDLFGLRRKKLVQGRIEQPDGHRQSVHGPENALEILLLHGLDLDQGGPAGVDVLGQQQMGFRLGTISGDDTIFVATATQQQQTLLVARLEQLFPGVRGQGTT